VFCVFNHPPFARTMIPTIALRVETQQSDPLAAVSQFIGFRLIPPDYHRVSYGNCDASGDLELLNVNPVREGVARWASGKITTLRLRATIASSVTGLLLFFRCARCEFLEARIAPKRIEHGIEPEQRGSKRHPRTDRTSVRYRQ
jgi:hypothetical protein